MPSLPAGIPGWTVFVTGLLIVALRVHGIDAPRNWIEWVERQFVDRRRLQFLGGILFAIVLVIGFIAPAQTDALGIIYILCLGLLGLIGSGLVFGQNQLRMMFVATGEAEDKAIRLSSIIFTVIGLLVALLPWFL